MTAKKLIAENRYSITGYIILIIGLAGICALLLFLNQNRVVAFGVTMPTAWMIWGVVFTGLLSGVIVFPFWLRRKFRKEQHIYNPENILASKGIQKATTKVNSFVSLPSNEIRQAMRYQYGRTWSRKLRILLVTGSVADIEQLTPNLTQELWQEDQGTLLLWGGELKTPADTDWLAALRKLRRRPVDGIVWVTSQLDSPAENAAPALSPDAMDSLAASLSARYAALGWQLPLYVWSLHTRAGQQADRITQPVGFLLPSGSRPEGLSNQLATLTPALIAQGIQ